MTEGVPEVQQRAVALFALIAPHDLRLDLARPAYDVRERRRFGSEQFVHVRFQPAEESGVADQAVFDDLSQPRPQFARRQGGKGLRIGNDRGGLVKRSDQVLAARMVDSGFSAHGRVHLRQQGRRDLNVSNTPLITRGGKPSHIADDTAPKGNDGAVPGKAVRDQDIEYPRHRGERFVSFPIGQDRFDYALAT